MDDDTAAAIVWIVLIFAAIVIIWAVLSWYRAAYIQEKIEIPFTDLKVLKTCLCL